jgi:hypothetical protein
MIRVPRIAGTAVFLAAWLMPWRPVFRIRAAGSRLNFFVHYRDFDMLDQLFNAGFQPYALDEQGSAVPISVGELRSFNGQMDLVMIKPAAP